MDQILFKGVLFPLLQCQVISEQICAHGMLNYEVKLARHFGLKFDTMKFGR